MDQLNKKEIESLIQTFEPFPKNYSADATVVILLKWTLREFKILLVQRRLNRKDPWSGQIGLPGGKRDFRDRNLKYTIIRETYEETNINLQQNCQFIGLLDIITSTIKPKMKIRPFIVLLEHEPLIILSEKELHQFFWISLTELRNNMKLMRLNDKIQPAYTLENIVIWGVTFRIIDQFMKTLDKTKWPRLITKKRKD